MNADAGEPAPLMPGSYLGCRRCPLAETRQRIVWGYGPRTARLMIVGQSPGAEEDARGRPLVGASGSYLASILKALKFDLDREAFRTNVNHCHPPGNRQCTPQEIRACRDLLEYEIETVNPDVIVALGAVAFKALVPGESAAITHARGQVYRREVCGRERLVVPTLHPAAVLRNKPAHERSFISDLRKAVQLVRTGKLLDETAAVPFREQPGTLDELLEAVKAPVWGFDLETTTGIDEGGDLRWASVIGIGVCAAPGNGIYVPLQTREEAAAAMEALKPYLEDETRLKVITNAKFERHICRNYGIEIRNFDDTLLMAWILGDFPLGLKDGYHKAFGVEMQRIEEFQKRGFRRKNPLSGKNVVDMEAAQAADPLQVAKYAAQDPDATLRLYGVLKQLLRQRGLWELYKELEVPFNDVILDMERTGMHFSPEALKEAAAEVERGYEEVATRLRAVAGEDFNVNSPKQVQELLYGEAAGEWRLQPLREKDGIEQRPTDAVSLAVHASNPLVKDVLTARAVLKLKGTYIDRLPRWISPKTGRIHPEYRQAAVATGRLSSANPNATNIPSRKRQDVSVSIDGSLIRKGFTAPAPDWSICGIDLSQIEMRIAAHLSGDEAMIRELGPGGDIHSNTARAIYRTTEEEVGEKRWKEMRSLAKVIGFGSLYGLAAPGLLKRTPTLGLTLEEAQGFIDGFYSAYPKLREWQQRVIAFCRRNGYAETILGRRRYFEEITSTDRERRGEAERGAINHPVQGSAADFFKLGVLGVYRWIHETGSRARIIALVHDELVLEAPNEELPALYEKIPPIMANAIPLKLPVFVDFEFGPSWGDVHAHDPEKWPFPAEWEELK